MSTVMCAVSGLPITEGDRVVYFLVSEYPYNSQFAHEASNQNGHWLPRTPPVRGVFRPGQEPVDHDSEDALTLDLWRQAFDLDAIEQGAGRYPESEPPITHGAPLSTYESAICNGRLTVDREYMSRLADEDSDALDSEIHVWAEQRRRESELTEPRDPDEPETASYKPRARRLYEIYWPPGVPSVDKVTAILEGAGQHLYRPTKPDDWGFLVDADSPVHVRIRWSGRNLPRDLKPRTADDAIRCACIALGGYQPERFATLITAQTVVGNHDPELQVFPAPAMCHSEWRGPKPERDGDARPLRISRVLILEAVWDRICAVDPATWRGPFDDTTFICADYVAAVNAYHAGALGAYAKRSSDRWDSCRRFWMLGPRPLAKDVAPSWRPLSNLDVGSKLPAYCVAHREHFQLLVERELPTDDPGVARCLRALGEFAFVADRLDVLEFKWEPSTWASHSYPPREAFTAFHKLVLDANADMQAEDDRKSAEFEEWERTHSRSGRS